MEAGQLLMLLLSFCALALHIKIVEERINYG